MDTPQRLRFEPKSSIDACLLDYSLRNDVAIQRGFHAKLYTGDPEILAVDVSVEMVDLREGL